MVCRGLAVPATRGAATTLATTATEASCHLQATKNPAFAGFFVYSARARYFFFGMYRSVIVPS